MNCLRCRRPIGREDCCPWCGACQPEMLAARVPRVFPYVRVQLSPLRFGYVAADGPAVVERKDYPDGAVCLLSVRYAALAAGPLGARDCDRLERHFARHGRLPGWARPLFPGAAPEGFDDRQDKYGD